MGQVAHALLTRPPLSQKRQAPSASFDLHVLSTPPAFILSQDQTLMLKFSLTGFKLGLFPFLLRVSEKSHNRHIYALFTVVGL